jgi:hypothetical protein
VKKRPDPQLTLDLRPLPPKQASEPASASMPEPLAERQLGRLTLVGGLRASACHLDAEQALRIALARIRHF